MLSLASGSTVRMVLTFALSIALVSPGWAQETASVGQNSQSQTSSAPLPQAPMPVSQQYSQHDYSKSRSQFPNIVAPYKPDHVPPPNLANTARIDSLIRDGKIYLSINDAVALALENNLDIVLARYNLNIADTDVLRAKAGSNVLGVNTGIVQNTPGGGTGGLSGTVGSGTGGTSVAAGGIGTGTNGLVSSTLGIGAPITSFDPVLSGTLQMDRDFAESTSVFTPIPGGLVNTNTGTANVSYIQGFHSGTDLSVGFNNTHVTTNNPTSSYTPSLASSFQVRVTQELLQGFGFLPNTRFIRIAKNNREISDVAFRLQIITTVDQIENLYWNLVYAYENVRVQQEALAFAQSTLEDNRKQVQMGTLPPIQVVSAQSTVSTDQQNVILARTNLELQVLLMKNALSRNLQDPHPHQRGSDSHLHHVLAHRRNTDADTRPDSGCPFSSCGTIRVPDRSEQPGAQQQVSSQCDAADPRCLRILWRVRHWRRCQCGSGSSSKRFMHPSNQFVRQVFQLWHRRCSV